ncbi:MAG: UvrD-helicase domain-containing protein [Pirellulales bacterium]
MVAFSRNIREALRISRLPALIDKEREKDKGGNSRTATDARAKVERLTQELESLGNVTRFDYLDANFSDYPNGKLSHDDIIAIATHLFEANATFRRITALRFPFILVDEAQDTFEGIVNGLNTIATKNDLCTVGYFGDPWQQIYDERAETFAPPAGGTTVSKTENFRCSESVIRLLNAFRDDVKQVASGENKGREGSVVFRLVKAETPELPRKRYSEPQIDCALASMDSALNDWGWSDRKDVMKLFLVRQMIARRMGFTQLNRLFNGAYASSRAEEQFGKGEHFLLLPLTNAIHPLIAAHKANDGRRVIDILRDEAPAFAPDGPNASKTLKSMIEMSAKLVQQLTQMWKSETIGEVLNFCVEHGIINTAEKLLEHLKRAPHTVKYDENTHSLDKGDWLADEFLKLNTAEVANYASFISNNTAFSTQHGVKGEEYAKVFVVYDDVEASWSNYSFTRLLTPKAAGDPTDGQRTRGRNLAYVSFSRAMEDLRVLLFTPNPKAARDELLARRLLRADQIQIDQQT